MTVQKVKLAVLVKDWDIYPRPEFSSEWVSSLVEKLEEGAELPPPVIARKGMRIVDGWHRVEALSRFHGSGAEIDADVRSYKSEADIVKDAISLNDPGRRGLPLSGKDLGRAVTLLERHGVPVTEIATIVQMPEQKVRIILIPPRKQEPTSRAAKDYAEKARQNKAAKAPTPAPPTLEQQNESRDWAYRGHARSVIRYLRSGDPVSEKFTEALWELHDLVEEVLERPTAA